MTAFVQLLSQYHAAFLSGLETTLQLSLIVWTAGLVVGGAVGVAAAGSRSIGTVMRGLSFVIGSIPVIVILMWLYYPAQALAQVVVSPFWTAAAALSVVNIVLVSEIVRSALMMIPREFQLAGYIYGISSTNVFWRISFPLLMRQILPPLLYSQVTMLQATLFASLISVEELFRVTQEINAQVYLPVQLFTALALFFLLVCAPLNGLAAYLKNKFGRDLSEV